MFAFLTAPVRLAVRVATREAAAAGMADGLADFRQDVAAALAEVPPAAGDTVRDQIRLALAGTVGALTAPPDEPAADKPGRGRKKAE